MAPNHYRLRYATQTNPKRLQTDDVLLLNEPNQLNELDNLYKLSKLTNPAKSIFMTRGGEQGHAD
ncbi:MAG: hypothetical protein WAL90_05010 [Desulfobacterales bacterium]